jgi:hypothetical protein
LLFLLRFHSANQYWSVLTPRLMVMSTRLLPLVPLHFPLVNTGVKVCRSLRHFHFFMRPTQCWMSRWVFNTPFRPWLSRLLPRSGPSRLRSHAKISHMCSL